MANFKAVIWLVISFSLIITVISEISDYLRSVHVRAKCHRDVIVGPHRSNFDHDFFDFGLETQIRTEIRTFFWKKKNIFILLHFDVFGIIISQ